MTRHGKPARLQSGRLFLQSGFIDHLQRGEPFLTFLLQLSSAGLEASHVPHGAVVLSLQVLKLEVPDHQLALHRLVSVVVLHESANTHTLPCKTPALPSWRGVWGFSSTTLTLKVLHHGSSTGSPPRHLIQPTEKSGKNAFKNGSHRDGNRGPQHGSLVRVRGARLTARLCPEKRINDVWSRSSLKTRT